MAFRFFSSLALIVALLAAPAMAQQAPVSEQDRAAIRTIIQEQVDAFRRDDGAAAFDKASPMIRDLFGTPETFMGMVRHGYPMVYRPKAFDFADIVMLNGVPTQKVHVVGPDGRRSTAFYPMARLPDGSWRIDGCYLEAADENQV
ncbi:MAG: DUF4864 domain-containing protein [Proteobacteria bacterium]|nr:DUF4864 domain-containing protein [Pseudomonadota bacterium]